MVLANNVPHNKAVSVINLSVYQTLSVFHILVSWECVCNAVIHQVLSVMVKPVLMIWIAYQTLVFKVFANLAILLKIAIKHFVL